MAWLIALLVLALSPFIVWASLVFTMFWLGAWEELFGLFKEGK